MSRPTAGPNPCLVCGAVVKKSLPDRATCLDCRAIAWGWFRKHHGETDPSAYQRAYNATFGTIDGLIAAINAAQAELVAA